MDREAVAQQLKAGGLEAEAEEYLLSCLEAELEDLDLEGIDNLVSPFLQDSGLSEDVIKTICSGIEAVLRPSAPKPQHEKVIGAPVTIRTTIKEEIVQPAHTSDLQIEEDSGRSQILTAQQKDQLKAQKKQIKKANRHTKSYKGKGTGEDQKIVSTSQVSRFHTRLNAFTANLPLEVDLKDVNLEIAGKDLLLGAELRLLPNRVYGFVGRNGCGKSTLLRQIANRKLIGMPPHISALLVDQDDVGSTEKSPLQIVMEADAELGFLLSKEQLLDGGNHAVTTLSTFTFQLQSQTLEESRYTAAMLSGARGKVARDEMVRHQQLMAEVEAQHQRVLDVSDPAALPQHENDVIDLYIRCNPSAALDSIRQPGSAADLIAAELAVVRDAIAAHGGREEKCAEASKILRGLGFSQQHLKSGTTRMLSGGWRMRVAIARALFADPDLLMLDEPTNHLDLKAVLWLEQWIVGKFTEQSGRDRILVVVSHDRQFLDTVCTHIISLKREALKYYDGNFSAYEEQVDDANTRRLRLAESISRQEELLKKQIDWMLQKARESGDDKRLKQVTSRRRKLEERTGLEVNAKGNRFKLNRDRVGWHNSAREDIRSDVAADKEENYIFKLPCGDAIGYYGSLLQLDEVSVGYDKRPLLTKVSLDLDMSSRVGILGENGSGKSTLLKCIAGFLDPQSGTRTQHRNLRIGFFTQHLVDAMGPEVTALEHMTAENPGIKEKDLRAHLGSFGIKGRMVDQPSSTLSGGQRVRACLATLTWTKPHILVLDEPTNHLDLQSVQALMVALNEFQGGLVIVSHDRSLLEGTCHEWVLVNGGAAKAYDGDVNTFAESLLS